ALEREIARREARVQLRVLADAWPPPGGEEVVPASELVRAAERARGVEPRTYVTIAGAVRAPQVAGARAGSTVEELVALAGGALADDWVAVAGGAPSGTLAPRDAVVEDPLLLILPASHEVVRRLRTPIADWLQRAASACEGCRLCSEACPAPLEPHQILWTLATLREDGVDLARALACTGCGLCDAVCPSVLSPRALTVAVRDRLRAAGANGNAARANRSAVEKPGGLDVALLTLRLGLAPFAAPPAIRV
ncbi:MAG TPA: 4Fe-4S dicluster domain-containing protein, partial [Polyangia bacterium]|nr:4Fe-4S dicluster domain-containing protein [Polyangia bacterium]